MNTALLYSCGSAGDKWNPAGAIRPNSIWHTCGLSNPKYASVRPHQNPRIRINTQADEPLELSGAGDLSEPLVKPRRRLQRAGPAANVRSRTPSELSSWRACEHRRPTSVRVQRGVNANWKSVVNRIRSVGVKPEGQCSFAGAVRRSDQGTRQGAINEDETTPPAQISHEFQEPIVEELPQRTPAPHANPSMRPRGTAQKTRTESTTNGPLPASHTSRKHSEPG